MIFILNISYSQPYNHPTVGVAGEYVGACVVHGCGPFNYYDNGGLSGDYSSNINAVYRVFCPSVAGRCMRVTFNSFDVENYSWFFGLY
jgi:hypothetical protein